MTHQTDDTFSLDDLPGLLRVLLWPAVAASIGSAATFSSVNSWYPTLEKPSFNPPKSAFGPAWTTLYLLMGIADYIISRQGDTGEVRNARTLYRIQLVLNSAWSVIFFGLRSPLAALIEMFLLWTAIVATIIAFARISKLAAALLVPYLAWTTFAATLNAAIWRKNT
ncbi:MAG TPA: TspO/MBR family protein [Thermomicrobiales bacterium]|nr:TspO/MBR family protein [Thermomicrobiales bacterium]